MELTITDSKENFKTWLSRDFVTDELRLLVSNASILIVPFENLRDTPNPLLFPIGTDEILRYFKEKLPKGQLIDICITDEGYQEFAFYSNYKRLGNFLVKEAALPIFVTIFSTFIYDKYIKEDDSKPQIQIIDNSTHTMTDDNTLSERTNNHISELVEKKYLEPTHIKFSVTIVDSSGTSKNIDYEGPASDIDNALKSFKEYEK